MIVTEGPAFSCMSLVIACCWPATYASLACCLALALLTQPLAKVVRVSKAVMAISRNEPARELGGAGIGVWRAELVSILFSGTFEDFAEFSFDGFNFDTAA